MAFPDGGNGFAGIKLISCKKDQQLTGLVLSEVYFHPDILRLSHQDNRWESKAAAESRGQHESFLILYI